MSDGRTYWYTEDAAYVSRELVVELGEEFGCAVLAVLQVLKGDAKLQDYEGGRVMTGFASVSRRGFVGDARLTRQIIEAASDVGLVDDLELLPDGKRFSCRLSGWRADQERGNSAYRQQKRRDRDAALRGVTHRDGVGADREASRGQEEDRNKTPTESRPIPPDVARLCDLLASLIRARDPKAKCNPSSKTWTDAIRLLIDVDGRDPQEVERVIRWCQADGFWQRNILSAPKLREKFTQLVAAAGQGGPGLRPVTGGKYDAAAAAKSAKREEAA